MLRKLDLISVIMGRDFKQDCLSDRSQPQQTVNGGTWAWRPPGKCSGARQGGVVDGQGFGAQGMDSKDTRRWNLQVLVIDWLVMGLREREEATLILRFLAWAGSDSLIHSSRKPWKRGSVRSHWNGLEAPRRANWNVPSLIPSGFVHCKHFSDYHVVRSLDAS